MTLGLFLLAGMISVFAGNKHSSEINTALANIQENARFALGAIAQDARMAGYQGCVDLNKGAARNVATDLPMDAGLNLYATATSGSVVTSSTTWAPDPPLGVAPIGFAIPTDSPATVGTHTLALQFANVNTGELADQLKVGVFASAAGDIVLNADIGLAAGDLAIIADCDESNLFRVSNVVANGAQAVISHAAPANSGNFSKAFGAPNTLAQTEVMQFNSNVYYIADTGLTNVDGDSISALFQQSLPYNDANNPPTELVQGVENMRIAFGIRQGNNAIRYVTPDSGAYDPTRIESIQIGLLISSWDRIAQQDDMNTYILAGQQVPAASTSTDGTTHAADRRFRLAFNTTIKIRNRRETGL